MPAASHVFQVPYVGKIPYACGPRGVPCAQEICYAFGVPISREPPTSLMLTLQKSRSAAARMLEPLSWGEVPAGSSAKAQSLISE